MIIYSTKPVYSSVILYSFLKENLNDLWFSNYQRINILQKLPLLPMENTESRSYIDQLFREKFRNLIINPPQHVWDKINDVLFSAYKEDQKKPFENMLK